VAEWCKIHGREVAGRLHCLCHQLQEVENKEQLSIFPAKTPAVAASVTVSVCPLFTILHRKALSHQQVDDAIGITLPSEEKMSHLNVVDSGRGAVDCVLIAFPPSVVSGRCYHRCQTCWTQIKTCYSTSHSLSPLYGKCLFQQQQQHKNTQPRRHQETQVAGVL